VEREIAEFNLPIALIYVEGQRVFSELYSDQFTTLRLSPGDYEIRFTIPLRFFKLEAHFLVVAALENGALADQVDGIPIPEIVDPEADPHMESTRWVVRLFNKHRKEDINLNIGISDRNGESDFFLMEDSGLSSFLPSECDHVLNQGQRKAGVAKVNSWRYPR
jgi:hypothetical protein